MSLAQRLSNIHGKSQDAAEMYFRQNLQNLQALHMKQEKPKADSKAKASLKSAPRKTPFIRLPVHRYSAPDIEQLALEVKVRYSQDALEAIATALNSQERSCAVTTTSGKLLAPGQKFCEEFHMNRGKVVCVPFMQLLEGANTNFLVSKRLFEYASLAGIIAYQCHILSYDGHRQPFLARITLVPLQPLEVCKDLGEEVVPNSDPLCIAWLERLDHEIDSDSACVLRQRHRFWYRFEHKVLYFQTTVDQFIVAPHCVVHTIDNEKQLRAIFNAVPVINIHHAIELGGLESVQSILKAYISSPEQLPPRSVRFHEYSSRPDLKACVEAVLKRGLSYDRMKQFLSAHALYIRGKSTGQLHLFPSVLAAPAPRSGSPSRPSCFSELPPAVQEIVSCMYGIERGFSVSSQDDSQITQQSIPPRLESRFSTSHSACDENDLFLALRGHSQVKLCDWFQNCLLMAMAQDLLPPAPISSHEDLMYPSLLSKNKMRRHRCGNQKALRLIASLGLEVDNYGSLKDSEDTEEEVQSTEK